MKNILVYVDDIRRSKHAKDDYYDKYDVQSVLSLAIYIVENTIIYNIMMRVIILLVATIK